MWKKLFGWIRNGVAKGLEKFGLKEVFGDFIVKFFLVRMLLGGVAGGAGYTMFQLAFNELKKYFYSGYNRLPYELVVMLDLAGFKMGFGILFGAISARMAGSAVARVFKKI